MLVNTVSEVIPVGLIGMVHFGVPFRSILNKYMIYVSMYILNIKTKTRVFYTSPNFDFGQIRCVHLNPFLLPILVDKHTTRS